MSSTTGGYYFPAPSKWPVVGSTAVFFIGAGLVMWMNEIQPYGYASLIIGFAILFYMLTGWFGQVAQESEAGMNNHQVDASYRWSMGWFIFSEVMFFSAFFGALYYARVFSVPWLGDVDNTANLWQGYAAAWPTVGPAFELDPAKAFQSMGAWGIPAINTALLLASGVTVTYAHHALQANNRKGLVWGLVATVALGAIFLGFQIYEYMHAYSDLNLKLTSGIFGSTFYMLTGFHGFHVTLGAIMLFVILIRSMKGHFKPDHHFGFEAAAWYWHFVDVVWLGLFIFVYVLV